MQVDSKEGGLAMLVDAAEAAPLVPLPIKKRKVAEPPTECRHAENQAAASKPSSEMESAHSREHFPQFLMSVLETEEYHDQIAWMPSGEAFTVVNPKAFKTDIMPKLFKIRIMSSFIRKLSRWGFHRVHDRHSKNSDIFRHDDFQRGRWDLCKTIKSVAKPSITSAYRGISSVARSVSAAPSSVEETRAPEAPVSPEGARSLAEGRPLEPPTFMINNTMHPLSTRTPDASTIAPFNHTAVPCGTGIHLTEHSNHAFAQAAIRPRQVSRQTEPVVMNPDEVNAGSAFHTAIVRAALVVAAQSNAKRAPDFNVAGANWNPTRVTTPSLRRDSLVEWLKLQLALCSVDEREKIMRKAVAGALSRFILLSLLQSNPASMHNREG